MWTGEPKMDCKYLQYIDYSKIVKCKITLGVSKKSLKHDNVIQTKLHNEIYKFQQKKKNLELFDLAKL